MTPATAVNNQNKGAVSLFPWDSALIGSELVKDSLGEWGFASYDAFGSYGAFGSYDASQLWCLRQL